MSHESPYGEAPDYGAAQPTPPTEPSTRQVLEAPAQMNPISRWIGALFSPGEMFSDVRRSPKDWWLPILILVIVASASGYVVQARFNLTPEVLATAIADMGLEQQGKVRKDLTEQEKQGLEMQEKITTAMYKAAPVTAGFFICVTVFLIGGIYRVLTLVVQARTTIFRCISVASYAYCVPQTLKWLLQIVLAFVKSPDTVDPVGYVQGGGLIHASPAAFMSMKAHPVLFSALSWIDLFSIWFLALAIIGISAVCVKKVKTGSAALVVVGPYGFLMLISIGLAAIFVK